MSHNHRPQNSPQTKPKQLEPGTSGHRNGSSSPKVIENWRKESVLGSGAFGIITLWKNMATGDMIALKQSRLSNSVGNDGVFMGAPEVVGGAAKQQKERWKSEVDIMHRLNHPNVVRTIKVPPCLESRNPELPSLGMEFCSGGDLRKVLSQPEYCNGVPEKSVRAILDQISSALLYLHSLRIIHRDLKPENIVIKELPNGGVIYKLIDLGYCKEMDASSLASSFVGTLQYLAPELFTSKSYTSSVDNWSFGLLVHEILTGRRPFLPNMSPAQWLPLVAKKKTEDICAVTDVKTNQVVFCKEISSFNHVSQTLKADLESWLRMMLEYDPKKRGGSNSFQTLRKDILSKTVVTVFVMNSLQSFSYEIKAETKILELKVLIESNTGFNRKDQLILIPAEDEEDEDVSTLEFKPRKKSIFLSGETLDSQKCSTLNLRNQQTLFLYHRTTPLNFSQYTVTSIIPPSVEGVLLNPTKLVTFDEMKVLWSHFLWVAQVLILKYNYLVKGHQSFLNYCLQSKETAEVKLIKTKTDLAQLGSIRKLVEEEINISLDKIKKRQESDERSCQDQLSLFLPSCEKLIVTLNMRENLDQNFQATEDALNEKIKRLNMVSFKRIDQTIVDPLNIPKIKHADQSSLTPSNPNINYFTENMQVFEVYSKMVTSFDEMRSKSREDRAKQTKMYQSLAAFDNTPMVTLICDLYQMIEKLIRKNYSEITRLLEISSGFNILGKEFKRIQEKVAKDTEQIKLLHRNFIASAWNSLLNIQPEANETATVQAPNNEATTSQHTVDKLQQMMSRLALSLPALNSTSSSSAAAANASLTTSILDSASIQLIDGPSTPSPSSIAITNEWTVINPWL